MVSGDPSISLLSYLSLCITPSHPFSPFLPFSPVFVSLSFFHFQSLVFVSVAVAVLFLFFVFVSLTHPPITSSSSSSSPSPRSLPPSSYLPLLFLFFSGGDDGQTKAEVGCAREKCGQTLM